MHKPQNSSATIGSLVAQKSSGKQVHGRRMELRTHHRQLGCWWHRNYQWNWFTADKWSSEFVSDNWVAHGIEIVNETGSRLTRWAQNSSIIIESLDTIKELMSYPKYRSVTVINNPARPGSNHREVNCINYN
jgi:hypothetical protein